MTAVSVATDRAGCGDVVDAPLNASAPWCRSASPGVDQAGSALARQAVALRMERVPFDEAVDRLLSAQPDWAVLQAARDYLARTRFEAPLLARSDALALIDAVLYRLDHPRPRRRPGPLRRGSRTRRSTRPAFRWRPGTA